MDTGKSLRKTGISSSGEIPSFPHNALLEILSRNHARVVPDGFLRDLPVSSPDRNLNQSKKLRCHLIFSLDYSRVEVTADTEKQKIVNGK